MRTSARAGGTRRTHATAATKIALVAVVTAFIISGSQGCDERIS
jgi:hypothetical protein